MNPFKNIAFLAVALVAMLLVTACSKSKRYNDEYSQQQEFPEREVTVDTSHVDSLATQKTDSLKVLSNHMTSYSHSSSTYDDEDDGKKGKHKYTYAEKKKTSELDEEYYDVFGNDFLDHIDDEEYEEAEEYDLDPEDHWESMPQEIVRNRPVKPQGQYHKFNPQDL